MGFLSARYWVACSTALLCYVHLAAAVGGAAPLQVALVDWNNLPRYQASGTLQAQLGPASALRAAGYPAIPRLSRPPFQRAADALETISQQISINAFGFATPIPLGSGAPSPVSSSTRRRLQQRKAGSLQHVHGLAGPSSTTPAGTAALAAGPHHLLQASGGLVTIYSLDSSSTQVLQHTSQSVALASLFSPVSMGCDGVFDPSATFDAAANRFLVSATCGGQGLLLLAVSSTSNAAGSWFISALVADGVGTSLACRSPVTESALVDYTQLSYNTDGVFVTYKSLCPSNTTHVGVGLLALPKWALYRGMPSFQYPIFTGAEVSAALLTSSSSSSSMPSASGSAARRDLEPSSSCAQLVPVLPQERADVGVGEALFVCELVSLNSQPGSGRSTAVVALLDTATLWQYGGPGSNTSAPLLVAQVVQLDAAAPPVTGLPLRQPAGAQPLQLGTRPRGFWNGAAVLSGGQLYMATASVAADKNTPSYSRRPAIAWAQLRVLTSTEGTDSCPQSRAGAISRQAWDWAKDYSVGWGQAVPPELAAAGAPPAAAPLASQAASPVGGDRVVHAAHLLPILGAAQAAAVGLSQLGANPCTCYSCFWGGQYNRYSGYNGGALAGTGSGFAAGGYYFYQGAMSRCQSFCTRCWYYGYPGHGFGNVGDDRTFMDLQAAAPFAANASGPSQADGPSLSINMASAAQATSLFRPCSRSGALQAQVVRQGVVTQGGARPLGLVFPALAVGRGGELLLTFSYSGPGEVVPGTPAFPGVGAAVVQPGSNASTLAVLQTGRGTIMPATLAGGAGVPPSGGWAELSAAAVHPESGALFTVTHMAAAAAAARSGTVGTWISSWQL